MSISQASIIRVGGKVPPPTHLYLAAIIFHIKNELWSRCPPPPHTHTQFFWIGKTLYENWQINLRVEFLSYTLTPHHQRIRVFKISEMVLLVKISDRAGPHFQKQWYEPVSCITAHSGTKPQQIRMLSKYKF